MKKLTEYDIAVHYDKEDYIEYVENIRSSTNDECDNRIDKFNKWVDVNDCELDTIFMKQAHDGTGIGIECGIKEWRLMMFISYEINQLKQKLINDEMALMVGVK